MKNITHFFVTVASIWFVVLTVSGFVTQCEELANGTFCTTKAGWYRVTER